MDSQLILVVVFWGFVILALLASALRWESRLKMQSLLMLVLVLALTPWGVANIGPQVLLLILIVGYITYLVWR